MPVEVSASGVAGDGSASDDAISRKNTAVGDIGIGSIASGEMKFPLQLRMLPQSGAPGGSDSSRGHRVASRLWPASEWFFG